MGSKRSDADGHSVFLTTAPLRPKLYSQPNYIEEYRVLDQSCAPCCEGLSSLNLADYGWSSFFDRMNADPLFVGTTPVRVMAVHRDAYDVAGPDFSGRIKATLATTDEEARPTVGDWLGIDLASLRIAALYPRYSLFKRRNAGRTNRLQLIAANVDTVFIVTSFNMDFKIARLERYLALAHEAGVFPVLLITKVDLISDIEPFLEEALTLKNDLVILSINARDKDGLKALKPWLINGKTVALMGSSGVGKSTIINSLLGREAQATNDIREADSRGRHTTSGRSLHRIKSGTWLIDTPGMREIQVVDSADGVDKVFDDVTSLSALCRFSNCTHNGEPGCAVEQAIEAGTLDLDRLLRFQKLQAEERQNTKSMYEVQDRVRSASKVSRGSAKEKVKRNLED
jgi:ribosome biogenesis GTPase / thiamine phosphate phosphatase